MIIEKVQKEPMEAAKVRQGTVFTYNGETFLKGVYNNEDCVVNLKTGNVTIPTKMDKCYIYPQATIRLISKV